MSTRAKLGGLLGLLTLAVVAFLVKDGAFVSRAGVLVLQHGSGSASCGDMACAREADGHPSIHVFIPSFNNLELLLVNIGLLVNRSKLPGRIYYTVLVMDDLESDRAHAVDTVQSRYPHADVHHLVFPPSLKGGQVLPDVFEKVLKLTSGDLTVFADTDALMLAPQWDARLDDLFSDEQVAVAAINPRVGMSEFHCLAEWNWMTIRTRVYTSPKHPFLLEVGLHDWGHSFTYHATMLGYQQHLWSYSGKFMGNLGSVAGDAVDDLFVVHSFYASRRHKDVPKGHPEAGAVQSDSQRHVMEEWAAQTPQERDLSLVPSFSKDECSKVKVVVPAKYLASWRRAGLPMV